MGHLDKDGAYHTDEGLNAIGAFADDKGVMLYKLADLAGELAENGLAEDAAEVTDLLMALKGGEATEEQLKRIDEVLND